MKIIIEIEEADIASFKKRFNALPPSIIQDLLVHVMRVVSSAAKKPKAKAKSKSSAGAKRL